MRAVSWTDARANGLEHEAKGGARFMRREYIAPEGCDYSRDSRETALANYERLKDEPEAPQAYLVQQRSGTVTSHFHRVPQYQVIAEGGGKLGRHDVQSVTVHYTDPYTGYGPIVAGEHGLSYFVMRPQFDPGAVYLDDTGARGLLQPSRKRHFIAGPDRVRVSGPDALAALQSSVLDEVIEAQPDGVAGYMLRVPARGSATGPDPATTGGQFYLVLSGEMEVEEKPLPFLSCVFVSRHDAPLQVRAGAAGAEALVLQFGRVRI